MHWECFERHPMPEQPDLAASAADSATDTMVHHRGGSGLVEGVADAAMGDGCTYSCALTARAWSVSL